jgi:methyl-accepting chemotaxis protein
MKMEDATKAGEFVGQMSGKAVETISVWADANQRILRELVELSIGAAKEGVRVYSELQQGAVESMRDAHATALKWQASVQARPNDPMEWYQKAFAESVDQTQKVFRRIEGNAQTLARSAERLQASAEQAGKGIQETVEATVARLKETCVQN